MATTYYPEKIYTCRDLSYDSGVATATITGEYSPGDDIVKQYQEKVLLVYDARSWGIHQQANNPKVAVTFKKKPSGTADTDVYSQYIYWFGEKNLSLGGNFSYKYSYDQPRSLSDGKIYICVGIEALNSSQSIIEKPITVAGFGFTFSTYGSYPFIPETDFAGGYKNPAKPFSITVSPRYYKEILTQYTIANAVFYIKESTASTYTSQAVIGNTVTVPAGTLQDSKVYDIYFDATDTEGTTVQCGQAQITTSDGPAVTTAVSPNNEVTYGTVPFRWNYSNITGELQHAFDLQISTDNSNWTDVFTHEVTDQTQVTAEITTSGTVYWRVRGYNQSDVAGAWSASVSFANVVPPQPPVILQIIPGGRIQVRWSATGQISYQMQVLQDDAVVYDSGIVYGTSTLARVNEYLTNGQYTVRVRISNSYGLTSQWSTMNYQQQNQLPNLTATANYSEALGGVRITVQDDDYEKFYLIRNGIIAAKFTGTEYIDQFAAGVTQYRLIGVTSEDNFGQAVFTVTVPTGSARLTTEDGQTLSVSERWDNMNNASQTEDIRYSANEFFGATAPEHTFSKMRTKRITRAFYDPDRISAQLLGKIAFYTDEYGNADWVAVLSRSRSDSWIGDETTIEMELTTRSEVITYDN
jgi:hypothetical protein